ncbi:MAG: nucleotide exchange factor GrpE [Tidjanibacter sp.]|nr:nucleotide exchange factor GrpE [Tidjanibacter sp.]MBQ2248175.1 nucleotide exchange factor GrpE [Tidjanibacter sp.]
MTKCKKEKTTAENQQVSEENVAPNAAENVETATPEADKVAEGEVAESAKTANAEAEEWKDKYLRLSAEFDNYRKRTLREKMELIESGGEDVIKAMLAVADDFDRALGAMQTATDVASVREGVELIHLKMKETLKGRGVSEIEAIGLPLDTDLHEAVAKFPAGDDKKGLIIDVVQKGYKLKEKVIRYAKVVVGE